MKPKRIHQLAAAFPRLEPEKLMELAKSIAENGLNHPILIQGDTLIDGRERLEACEMAEVAPRYIEMGPDEDAEARIMDENYHRRHLSKGQLAMIYARTYPTPKKRGRKKGNTGIDVMITSTHSNTSQFSNETLSHARTILKKVPEKVDEIIAGKVELGFVYKQLTTPKVKFTEEEKERIASIPDPPKREDSLLVKRLEAAGIATEILKAAKKLREIEITAEFGENGVAMLDRDLSESSGIILTFLRSLRAATMPFVPKLVK